MPDSVPSNFEEEEDFLKKAHHILLEVYIMVHNLQLHWLNM